MGVYIRYSLHTSMLISEELYSNYCCYKNTIAEPPLCLFVKVLL
jgi:hypothetical protein